MVEDPSPPPEEEEEEQEIEQPPMPFFNVSAAGGGDVVVRAGWAEDGEVAEVVLSYSGAVGQAEQVMMSAFAWYVQRLKEINEIARAQQE